MNLIQSIKKLFTGILVGTFAIGCAGNESSQGPVYSANGVALITFSKPLSAVSTAASGALEHMGINVVSREQSAIEEVIKAEASPLQIELRLQAITPKTTRMEVIAQEGLWSWDQETAMEIAVQTDKTLHQRWSIWR